MKPLMVPDMEEVHEGGMKRSVRDIRIEDLLGREAVSYTHLAPAEFQGGNPFGVQFLEERFVVDSPT